MISNASGSRRRRRGLTKKKQPRGGRSGGRRTVSAPLLELGHIVLLSLTESTLGFTILGTVSMERKDEEIDQRQCEAGGRPSSSLKPRRMGVRARGQTDLLPVLGTVSAAFLPGRGRGGIVHSLDAFANTAGDARSRKGGETCQRSGDGHLGVV